ncbi:MAG TPA: AMED_5909 family protein [Pseudonocardiaceae bacterium]|jgi:hypothetical protein|nr:AMED_5909 family protein [Pseudonocardiaceae bacterium]
MSGKNGQPRTLGEAHDALRRVLPFPQASAQDWLAHHERAAQLYQHISQVDPSHHHEALAFAAIERADAATVAAQIRASTAQARPEIDQPSGGAR